MRTTSTAERRSSPAPATRTTVAVLGVLAAFTGVEHGLGAITQGTVRPAEVVFESWPHAAAFEPLNGEPAMTLVPNLSVSGALAIAVALAVGTWALRYAHRRHGGPVLVGLALVLLLVGGGFGPPLLAALAGLLAGRITAHPRAPQALTGVVARLWPWPLVLTVTFFLALVPGVPLLAVTAQVDSPVLVGVLSVGAFVATGLAMWTARAYDVAVGGAPARGAFAARRGAGDGRRHRVFRLWAGVWGTLVALVFGAVTILTLTLWLTEPAYAETTPEADVAFLTVGATIAVGLLSQRRPVPHVAGLQQAILAALALATAGLVGRRVEPLVGAVVILAVLAVQAALHPARRALLRSAGPSSPAMVVLALLAAVPGAAHAVGLLGVARDAGPSCFLGQCAAGDRPAELAAALITVPLVGMLAGLRTQGWRIPLWTAAAAALAVGTTAVLVADTTTSTLGRGTGLAAVAWAVAFVWVGEREHRRAGGGDRPGDVAVGRRSTGLPRHGHGAGGRAHVSRRRAGVGQPGAALGNPARTPGREYLSADRTDVGRTNAAIAGPSSLLVPPTRCVTAPRTSAVGRRHLKSQAEPPPRGPGRASPSPCVAEDVLGRCWVRA